MRLASWIYPWDGLDVGLDVPVEGLEGRAGLDGMRVFYPEMKGPDDLASRAGAATGADAAEINFHNYRLVLAVRLDCALAAEAVAR